MFEEIKPGGSAAAAPAPPLAAPKAGEGVISPEEAIKGGEHAKMTSFSVGGIAGGAPGSTPASGSSVQLGGLVQGKMAVDLIDALIPSLIVLVFKRFKIEARKSAFQLTQGEKNTLSPIVEACLNSINLDFSNPWNALTISMLIIYGGKAMEIGGVAWMDRKAAGSGPTPPAGTGGPAPVIPITANPTTNPGAGKAKPPQPAPPKPSTNTDNFIAPYTEEHIAKVLYVRRNGRADTVKWLDANWEKIGGVLPDRYANPKPKKH